MKYIVAVINFIITILALWGSKTLENHAIFFNFSIIFLAFVILIFNIITIIREQKLREITPTFRYIDEES